MATNPGDQIMIDQRRQQCADLYVQGWTQAQIAEELNVVQSTVSSDLQALRTQWRESGIRDFDLSRAIELEKLDRIEREAWDAWERSKRPAQSAVVSGDAGNQQTRRSTKSQIGDPRFLDLINKCIAQRRALLGLDTPLQLSERETDATGTFDIRCERAMALIAVLGQRERIATTGTGSGGAEPSHVRTDRE